MTKRKKPESHEDKDQQQPAAAATGEQKHQPVSSGRTKGRKDRKNNGAEAAKASDNPVAPAIPPQPDSATATATASMENAANQTATASSVAEPAKKVMTTEQVVDTGLKKLVRDELKDRAESDQITRQLGELQGVIESLGLEVPEGGSPVNNAALEDGGGKKKTTGGGNHRGHGKAPGGGGLWEIVRDHLAGKGCVETKFEDASVLLEIAVKAGYSTAANLLSSRVKDGHLVKPKDGTRGKYALPKNWKNQP